MSEQTAITGINKSDVVRLPLEGYAYIEFNELVSRLAFDEKMSPRRERESVVGMAVNVLNTLVRAVITKTGATFIKADAVSIVSAATRPEKDYQDLYFKLLSATTKAAEQYDSTTELMPSKAWAAVKKLLPEPESKTEDQD